MLKRRSFHKASIVFSFVTTQPRQRLLNLAGSFKARNEASNRFLVARATVEIKQPIQSSLTRRDIYQLDLQAINDLPKLNRPYGTKG
ncbi:MAG: hypothetical protein L0229_28830 [Blastocatellia bacterium]|nr:hypothetical protein [Blastocatellia bacterium]